MNETNQILLGLAGFFGMTIATKLIEVYFSKKTKAEDHLEKKIEDDIQIINNVISSSSSAVFFEVKFKATIFKPKVNVEYKGFVCMVFSQGIFVEVFNNTSPKVWRLTTSNRGLVTVVVVMRI